MFKLFKSSSINTLNKNPSFSYKSNLNFLKKEAKNMNSLNKGLVKRNFQGNFNGIIPNSIKYIIGAGVGIYFLSFTMQGSQYIRTFFYNSENLKNGNILSLATCHVGKSGFLDLLLDSIFLCLLSTNINIMFGQAMLNKLLLSSAIFTTIGLIVFHARDKSYIKSDAFMRGIIYFFVLSNPQQTFYLFPLPIQIKAKYIGLFIAALDIVSKKYANFGGAVAAQLCIMGSI